MDIKELLNREDIEKIITEQSNKWHTDLELAEWCAEAGAQRYKEKLTEQALLKVDGDLVEKLKTALSITLSVGLIPNRDTFKDDGYLFLKENIKERITEAIIYQLAPHLQAAEREIERLKVTINKQHKQALAKDDFIADLYTEKDQAVQQERERIKKIIIPAAVKALPPRYFRKLAELLPDEALEGKHE